jgi:predicted phosphoadenosine phosphosulfate sulfurtransferase
MWFQIPFRLTNAASAIESYLVCWDETKRDQWVHEQDPISIKENKYGKDRFGDMFAAIAAVEFPGVKTAYIAGVRCEESPTRFAGLTYDPTYKWATWGSVQNKKHEHYSLYPIYDWSYLDVWKAILDNGWSYNRIYDAMYRYGVPLKEMRVSNNIHETSVRSLFYMQEMEPETWSRLTARLAGVDMAAKMEDEYTLGTELPFMFDSWREYRDYLLEHLIIDPRWRKAFASQFASHDRKFGEYLGDHKYRAHIKAILLNDHEGVTLKNFGFSPQNQWAVKAQREALKEAEAVA